MLRAPRHTSERALPGAAPSGATPARGRPGFEDLLLFPYLAVFVRQYLWGVEAAWAAWAFTLLLTAAAWLLLWRTRLAGDEEGRRPRRFWLVVGLPLLLVYALRAALPDASYDVLNYRLVSAERALRGWPFLPGDFFPPFYPLNPAPDMLLGLFRHLLGYRLGTVGNLLGLLWAAAVVEKLLRPHVLGEWRRSLATLFVLWAEHVLFLAHNYMVDFLPVPPMLEAARLALRAGEPGGEGRRLFRIALLTGIAGALKPLYLAYAIPVAVIYLHSLATSPAGLRLGRQLRAAPAALAAFLFPLAPHALYMYRVTGNPVFPLFNKIFGSPLWPPSNVYDGRWGPKTLAEMFYWPARVAFDATRTGELNVYSGRVTLVLLAAIVCLLAAWREPRLRALALATVAGAYLWGTALTGYARYAVFVEVLGGVMLVGLGAHLWSRRARTGRTLSPAAAAVGVLALLAGAQAARASVYVLQRDWGARPTALSDWAAYKGEARYVLRDYRLDKFLDEREAEHFRGVGAWVEAGMLSSGPVSLLDPAAPILCAYVPDYFYRAEGREMFARALAQSAGRRVAALCLASDLAACRRALAERGLGVAAEVPVTMPIYSRRWGHRMILLDVRAAAAPRVEAP